LARKAIFLLYKAVSTGVMGITAGPEESFGACAFAVAAESPFPEAWDWPLLQALTRIARLQKAGRPADLTDGEDKRWLIFRAIVWRDG
jgi:hypothetical protein